MTEYKLQPYRVLLLLLSVLILFWYCKMGLQWWDFEGQWTISTYFCHQLNPYLPHSLDTLANKGLGEIPAGWGTSPWGLILGQFLYPGVLKYQYAQIYFVGLYFMLYAIAIFYAWRTFPKHRTQLILFASLATVNYFRPMLSGNAGGIMCLLLLLAVALQDKNQAFAGLLLAFAMIKPQLALLFCLYFLLRKRYILLAVTFIVDVLSWVAASIMLETSMWQLLYDFLHCNIGGGGQFAGIFTLAFSNSSTAMLASMTAGILYATIYYAVNKGKGQIAELASFCIATSFWSYSWGNEYMVLLPVSLLAYKRLTEYTTIKQIKWLLFIPYSMLAVVIIIVLTTISTHIAPQSAFHIAMTLYSIGLMVFHTF